MKLNEIEKKINIMKEGLIEKKTNQKLSNYNQFSAIISEFLGIIIFCFLSGYYLSIYFNKSYILVIFLILGVFASVYNISFKNRETE